MLIRRGYNFESESVTFFSIDSAEKRQKENVEGKKYFKCFIF